MTTQSTKTYTYTSMYQLNIDLDLYMTVIQQAPLTLDLFPTVAQDRYFWFVDNWNTYKESFKEFAGGDEYLEAQYTDLSRSIQSTQIGNRQNIFAIPEKFVNYSAFLQLITLDEMNLTRQEQDVVNIGLKRVNDFDISRFQAMLVFLKEQSALTAQFVGLGDEDAAEAKGITVAPRKRTANFSDVQIMSNGIDLERFVESIIYDLKQNQKKPPNLLTVANSNLDPDSEVSVQNNYLSYFSAPFQGSLPAMAKRYLGDSNRWFELVTVNNLKPPFIDENGTKVFLKTSGSGNTVYIDDTIKDSIKIGNQIRIGSLKVREEPRIVERIIDNKDGTLTVFLSGDKDISKFVIVDKPYIRVYKPNTVNGSSFILIPTTVDSPLKSFATPSSDILKRLDQALLNFGVDIQRDPETDDFIIDSNGNFQFCAGVPNVRQTVSGILRTTTGELNFHDNYGIPAQVGQVYLGSLDERAAVADGIIAAIQKDTRFTGVFPVRIEGEGVSVRLDMLVTIQGSQVPIPLSFVE